MRPTDFLKTVQKERVQSDFIPFTHLNAPNQFESRNGQLGIVIRLSGVNFHTALASDITIWKKTLHDALSHLDARFCVFQTLHRRREAHRLSGSFPNAFADNLDKAYHAQFADGKVNATPISLPHFAGSGIEGALQSVLIEVTDIGTWSWQAGGFRQESPWLLAVLIWGFGYTMLLLGTFEIVLAKLMLAILFTLAPLFISFTLFKPTQGFFDRWLGLIASYAFLLIFISAALALALNFAEWALGDLYNTHTIGVELIDFVPALFVCFMGIGIIFKVAELAHHIANGVCTSSATGMVAGSVGGFLGGMSWAYKKLRRQ